MGSIANKGILKSNGTKGILKSDGTISVDNGIYKIPVYLNEKPRAKVFSTTTKFFDSQYFDVYNAKKDAYVKDNKGRKYYLRNAKISSDGKTLYV